MQLAPLLAPISADQPGGIDLSFSPEVDAIEEMRREDDPTLDQGEWVSALKSADWAGVARDCQNILTTRSKNLRVAGWLADAWGRLRGFEGLADGLDLVAGLVDVYWEELHPMPDGGDVEERVGNLRWLAARIEQLVSIIPLVTHQGRHSSLAAIGAARSKRLADTGSAGAAVHVAPPGFSFEPALTLEIVWRDVNGSGREAARIRRAQVSRARAMLVRLQGAVDAPLGDEAPSFVAPREAFDKALDELSRLERECGFSEVALADASTHPPVQITAQFPASNDTRTPFVTGGVENRTQALEQLRRVATFFRSTEPHSPVAYLADKAVRWSEMPLHEWLRAVLKDGGALAHVEELLGFEKPEGR